MTAPEITFVSLVSLSLLCSRRILDLCTTHLRPEGVDLKVVEMIHPCDLNAVVPWPWPWHGDGRHRRICKGTRGKPRQYKKICGTQACTCLYLPVPCE